MPVIQFVVDELLKRFDVVDLEDEALLIQCFGLHDNFDDIVVTVEPIAAIVGRQLLLLMTCREMILLADKVHACPFVYISVVPPSTTMACPTTNRDASEHSHNTTSAISSRVPKRPAGIPTWKSCSRALNSWSLLVSCPMNALSMSVGKDPGHTALTRMPDFMYSTAAHLVRPKMPCLLAL